ncbi:MAG: Ig-like domain-containing protein, partial [archaeon]|nr:Ig-like domain-containing protein [archaeon]
MNSMIKGNMLIVAIIAVAVVAAGAAFYSTSNPSPTGDAQGNLPVIGLPTPCEEDGNCVDTIPPVLVITYPSQGQTVSGTITVTADANDNDRVMNVRFFIDNVAKFIDFNPPYAFTWDTTDVVDGNHTIKVVAKDAAGNTTTKTRDVFVDNNTTVTVTITYPTSNPTYDTNLAMINLGGTASGNLQGVTIYWGISTDGNGIASGVANWTTGNIPLAIGQNQIIVTAKRASQIVGSDSIIVTRDANGTDTNAPFVIITLPTSNPTYDTNSSTINLSGLTNDNIGVISVTWGINTDGNGTAVLSQANTYWTANNLPLILGANIITIRAYDAAGNVGQDVITVTRDANQTDTQNPTITIISPQNNEIVGNTINIAASASDNVGVTRVEFVIDNVLRFTDYSTPYVYIWNTTAYTDGNHSIKATAFDAANNSAFHQISVIVDNNAVPQSGPEITITNPQANSTVSGTID